MPSLGWITLGKQHLAAGSSLRLPMLPAALRVAWESSNRGVPPRDFVVTYYKLETPTHLTYFPMPL